MNPNAIDKNINTHLNYHSGMLLRQYPWIKDMLADKDMPIALSFRKPQLLFGVSLIFIGSVLLIDALINLLPFSNTFFYIATGFLGTLALYRGIWELKFSRRSYILVTKDNVIYQKISLTGKIGNTITISRSDIKRAHLLKSTVMYLIRRSDGSICLSLKNGKKVFIDNIKDGETICEAVQWRS